MENVVVSVYLQNSCFVFAAAQDMGAECSLFQNPDEANPF